MSMFKHSLEDRRALQAIIVVFKKYFILLTTISAVVFAAVVGYGFTRTPSYAATAQLNVSYQYYNNGETSNIYYNNALYIESQLETYKQVIETETVLKPVIDNLDLNMHVNDLASSITVTVLDSTTILEITVRNQSARKAADIANYIAEYLYSNGEEIFLSPIVFTIIQDAYTTNSPSYPNKKLYILIGALAGIVIGMLSILCIGFYSHSINNIEELYSIPVIGVVKNERHLFRGHKESGFDVKRLCNNLLLVDKPRNNTFIVTSPNENDIRSSIIINLAKALSDTSKKVLIIDFDGDSYDVCSRLGLSKPDLSFSYTDICDFEDFVQNAPKSNISFISLGIDEIEDNKIFYISKLLSDLDRVSASYDYCFVNVKSLNISEDAILLEEQDYKNILVLDLNKTKMKEIDQAIYKYANLGFHPLAVVVVERIRF